MSLNEEEEIIVGSDAESMEVSGTDRKWTEIELLTIRVSSSESNKIPSGITNPFVGMFWAFIYAFLGHYYTIIHTLYPYFLRECGLCWTVCGFVCCCVPLIFTILCIVFPPIMPLGAFLPLSWWLCDVIISFIFARGMKRVSYIEEHRMKGSDYHFGLVESRDSGTDFDWVEFLTNLLISLAAYICKRLAQDIILLTVSTGGVLLNFILPGIGSIIFPFILFWALAMSMGYSAFTSGLLNRKYDTFFEQVYWAFRHHWFILGYGLGCICIYCIPVLQVTHYFFGAVGATRFVIHYEEKLIQEQGEKQRLIEN